MSAPKTPEADRACPAGADSLAAVEASLRWPVLHFLAKSAFWLVMGTLLATIASIQLHSPEFLAGCTWLTHGKVRPAAWTALIYGFGGQLAFGLAIYVICRLSRRELRQPLTVLFAGKLWSLGVALGLIGIFIGDSTGHTHFELPGYSSWVLLVAGIAITLKALVALHGRVEREMYASQWFLAASLVWFVWVLSTGVTLLGVTPVQGAAQLAVNGWFVNNLFQVVLGLAGLGAVFYFTPQIARRPLASRELATIAFWLIVLVGGWTGITGRLPLPSWISAVSTAAGFLMLAPLALVLGNLGATVRPGFGGLWSSAGFRCFLFGTIFYALWVLRGSLTGLGWAVDRLQFTHFVTAQDYLFVFGFLAFVGVGAIHSILPRLTGGDCDCPRFGVVVWAFLVGTLLTAGPLSLAGFLQGSDWLVTARPFLNSIHSVAALLKLASLGNVVLLAASVMLLLGVSGKVLKRLRAEYPVETWCRDDEAVAGKTTEVRA